MQRLDQTTFSHSLHDSLEAFEVGLKGKCFLAEVISHYDWRGRWEETGVTVGLVNRSHTESVSRRDLNPRLLFAKCCNYYMLPEMEVTLLLIVAI